MIYGFYITTDTPYIPNIGGQYVFTIHKYIQENRTKTKVNLSSVYSENDNFAVTSVEDVEDFGTRVTIQCKPISQISWETDKDAIDQVLRVSYTYLSENGRTFLESFTLPFIGQYNCFLEEATQKVIGNYLNGTSVLSIFSYASFSTNAMDRYYAPPVIETTDPDKITVNVLYGSPVSDVYKVKPFTISVAVSGEIIGVNGVNYDLASNCYTIPIKIKQVEITKNKRISQLDPSSAKEITFNVKFKTV